MSLRSRLEYFCAALVTGLALAACSGSGLGPVNGVESSGGVRSERDALLYVSDPGAGTVWIYSYPGLKRVAKLAGLYAPEGLCVDSRTGGVWVTNASSETIAEFAHGGKTPIKTLDMSKELGGQYLDGCAVDAGSGDLAVAVGSTDDPGAFFVFKGGRGEPAQYPDPRINSFWSVGYDPNGNVYVDGQGSPFRFDELMKGSSQLHHLPVTGAKIEFPGSVQYDGTNLTVGDAERGFIYRLSGGKVIGTTKLGNACFVRQFFIDRGRVVTANACQSTGEVLIYDYPAGGAPVKTIGGFITANGAVISR
jgi:hypothetical protein